MRPLRLFETRCNELQLQFPRQSHKNSLDWAVVPSVIEFRIHDSMTTDFSDAFFLQQLVDVSNCVEHGTLKDGRCENLRLRVRQLD